MDTQEQLAQARQLIADKQYEEAKAVLRGLPDDETAQQWLAKLESMPSGEVQAKLEQAGGLIKQKQYAKARAILTGIADHPTAQQWLNQIDKITSETATRSPAPARAAMSGAPVAGTPAAQPGNLADLADLRAESAVEGPSPLQVVMNRVVDALNEAEIDLPLARRVLIIAAISGLLAALLDKILGMPGLLIFTFGGFVALLNGPVYATITQKTDRAAWIMSAVSGLVAMFVWWLIMAIILGSPDFMKDDDTSHNIFRFWFDEYTNILKALITGPVMGLIGLGWQWLVPRLPHDAASLRAMVPGRGGDQTEG